MTPDAIRPGGLFRCCIASIMQADQPPGTEGEIRGCTIGKGCDARVVFRIGAWEWLRPKDLGGWKW